MTFAYAGFTFENIDDGDLSDIQFFTTELIDQLTLLPVNAPAGVAYVLALQDAKKLIQPASADPFTLTVPTNASVPFSFSPATVIPVLNLGAGIVTVTPASGAVSISGAGLQLPQFSLGWLFKTGTNSWVFVKGEVSLTGVQTLTNKTLTSPIINTPTVTGGTVNPTTLQQGGVQAVTVSSADVLTNKTLTSPISTGTPTSPTAAPGTNTTQAATTAFVTLAVSLGVVNPLLTGPREKTNIVASGATGTINVDVGISGLWYYTVNASANFTLNFRQDAGVSLNTLLATGESITVTFLNTNGATAFFPNLIRIDAVTVTPKWQFGAAPTAGNINSIDAYTFIITKTGAATFVVLAAQVRFA